MDVRLASCASFCNLTEVRWMECPMSAARLYIGVVTLRVGIRVGLARAEYVHHTPYMTVYLVTFLPKVHCIYMVLVNHSE